MSNKKFTYRSPVIWNVILFVAFSYVFILLQHSYINSLSLGTSQDVLAFVTNQKSLAVLFVLTILAAFRLSKFISWLFWLTVATTSIYTCLSLWQEFSKFVIVLLFFYIVFSYYLYQFLKQDLNESYYNPLFDSKFIFEPMCRKIPVEIDLQEGKVIESHLTNWSQGGFFLFIKEPQLLKGLYQVRINYEGHVFETKAKVVTRLKDNTGVGMRVVEDTSKNSLNWKNFINIISEMGYQPELLV